MFVCIYIELYGEEDGSIPVTYQVSFMYSRLLQNNVELYHSDIWLVCYLLILIFEMLSSLGYFHDWLESP